VRVRTTFPWGPGSLEGRRRVFLPRRPGQGKAEAGENVESSDSARLGALDAQAAAEVAANVYVAEINESLHPRVG